MVKMREGEHCPFSMQTTQALWCGHMGTVGYLPACTDITPCKVNTHARTHTHVIKIHILNACWHMNSYHWLFKCKAKYMQLSHAPFTWAILKWQWVCSQNMSGPKKKNTGKTGQKCSWPSKHTGTNTSHTNAHIVQTHWNNTHRSFLWSIYHSLNKVTTHVQEVDATFGKTYISGWQQSHITIYTACYTCSIAGENINEIAHKKTIKKGASLQSAFLSNTMQCANGHTKTRPYTQKPNYYDHPHFMTNLAGHKDILLFGKWALLEYSLALEPLSNDNKVGHCY